MSPSNSNLQNIEGILARLFDKDQEVVPEILKRIDVEERNRITQELVGTGEYHAVSDNLDTDLKIRTLITLCIILSNNEAAQRTFSASDEVDGIMRHIFVSLYELSKAASTYGHDKVHQLRYALVASIAAVLADKHSEASPFVEDFLLANDTTTDSLDESLSDLEKLQYMVDLLLLKLVVVIKSNRDKESLIEELRACRTYFDELQNGSFEVSSESAVKIHQLAAIGNLLYMIDSTLTFLFTGTVQDDENIYTVLDNYSYNAITLYRITHSVNEENLSHLTRLVLEQFCRNSVWNIADRSPIFASFFKKCMESSNNILYTLLPPQRDKILDLLTVKKSIVINMPTSAGKSLLAELYILFTLFNNSDEDNPPTVCYLVPTNALINQVKHRLAKAFDGLHYNVDGVLPFYDIDPIEDEILKHRHIHVLVSTPEKMDSLIRQDHAAVNNLKLVILDEAHNIGDSERGAKMELLLSIIKRKKSDARFLLLSPFIKNANDIAKWLGETEQDSLAIRYEWSPTKQYVGASQIKRSGQNLTVQYFPSGRDSLITDPLEVEIYRGAESLERHVNQNVNTTEASLLMLAQQYARIGTTLIICNGIATSQKLATQLYEYLQEVSEPVEIHERVQEFMNLVKIELGEESALVNTLAYGIAYHHSRLPSIIKEEMEELIREGFIKYIYATTTLAQGMNFPITTVIFKDLRMGGGEDGRTIDNPMFWNIAGRAGRAYMDSEGHILLLHKSSRPQSGIREITQGYIKGDLVSIESSLKHFFETFNSNTELNYALVKKDPAISSFLQYLNHLIRISHDYDFQAVDLIKIRSMLSNSLLFNQIRVAEGFLESQQQITSFARTYINQISRKNVGQLKLADLFGISDISLSKFYSEMNRLKEELAVEFGPDVDERMKASRLVLDSKDSNTFSKVVEILATIPELKVFITGSGSLDSKSIADVVIGWVNGKPIIDIARTIKRDNQSLDEAVSMCHGYINGRLKTFVPWGVSIYQNLTSDDVDNRAKNLPSYIYFGVNDNDSVILSTAGVPRFALNETMRIYKRAYGNDTFTPQQIDMIKNRLRDLDYGDVNIPNMNARSLKRLINKYL